MFLIYIIYSDSALHENKKAKKTPKIVAPAPLLSGVQTARLPSFCCQVHECLQKPYYNSKDLKQHMSSKHPPAVVLSDATMIPAPATVLSDVPVIPAPATVLSGATMIPAPATVLSDVAMIPAPATVLSGATINLIIAKHLCYTFKRVVFDYFFELIFFF